MAEDFISRSRTWDQGQGHSSLSSRTHHCTKCQGFQ